MQAEGGERGEESGPIKSRHLIPNIKYIITKFMDDSREFGWGHLIPNT